MNILITDDRVLLRDGLRLLLEPLSEVVNFLEAGNLQQALSLIAQEEDIDLVLLELGAPGVDGLFGLRTLRERLPGAAIVVLGAAGTRDDVIAALESGANGYIPKTANGKLLLSALRLVLAGETYVPSSLLADRDAREADADDVLGSDFRGPLARLTGRQREVLMHLAQGRSNAEIAEALGMRPNTAKNHLKAILKTLNANNRTQAVVEAMRLGMRPPGTNT